MSSPTTRLENKSWKRRGRVDRKPCKYW